MSDVRPDARRGKERAAHRPARPRQSKKEETNLMDSSTTTRYRFVFAHSASHAVPRRPIRPRRFRSLLWSTVLCAALFVPPRPATAQSPHPDSAGLPATTIQKAMQRSEEHTSELQSLMRISYAVFCLKKKNTP